MDLKHTHGTSVTAIRACYNEDGSDLLAVAGSENIQVLQCSPNSIKQLAFFTLGSEVVSLAWSQRSVSPSSSDEWFLELVASTQNFSLHILTKGNDAKEEVFSFGGSLTGHHGRVNDVCFVGGHDGGARHVASVSDDQNLIVWDLYPVSVGEVDEGESEIRRQPTALVIPFTYHLCSVSSHVSTARELVVSDTRGYVFVVDWRKDPDEGDDPFTENLLELVHPKAVANAACNLSKQLTGCAAWRKDDPNIIGAVFGNEFAIWDLTRLGGGKPVATGVAFLEGAHRFRWCPSIPDYFALSPSAMTREGALVKVLNTQYLQAQANSITVAPRPRRVSDMDWIATKGMPRLAVAIERDVYIFPISEE